MANLSLIRGIGDPESQIVEIRRKKARMESMVKILLTLGV